MTKLNIPESSLYMSSLRAIVLSQQYCRITVIWLNIVHFATLLIMRRCIVCVMSRPWHFPFIVSPIQSSDFRQMCNVSYSLMAVVASRSGVANTSCAHVMSLWMATAWLIFCAKMTVHQRVLVRFGSLCVCMRGCLYNCKRKEQINVQ